VAELVLPPHPAILLIVKGEAAFPSGSSKCKISVLGEGEPLLSMSNTFMPSNGLPPLGGTPPRPPARVGIISVTGPAHGNHRHQAATTHINITKGLAQGSGAGWLAACLSVCLSAVCLTVHEPMLRTWGGGCTGAGDEGGSVDPGVHSDTAFPDLPPSQYMWSAQGMSAGLPKLCIAGHQIVRVEGSQNSCDAR
jgi:hypothetical protein